MDDLLKQSAKAYSALMPYRYHFTLGHKGRITPLVIEFPVEAYHHLAGFHKIGFAQLNNKRKALSAILSGVVTAEQVARAGYCLVDRWQGICHLQAMLEENKAVFRYRGHERADSNIVADYLLVDVQTIFFVAADHPASIFGQKGQNYERNCPKLTTLLIEREEVSSGIRTELYRAKSYIDQGKAEE